MEFKRRLHVNLSIKPKYNYKCRKQIYRYWGRVSGKWRDKLEDWDWHIHTAAAAAAAAKLLQSCLTLCDPIDSSLPGFPVSGILQARTLEWVAISFSNAWKWKVKVKSLSRVRPSATPWTAAYQAPPSMGFSRQEYWSGVPSPSLSCSWKCSNSRLRVTKWFSRWKV